MTIEAAGAVPGSGEPEGLSHLELLHLPLVPLIHGAQVSNDAVHLGLSAAMGTGLLFSREVAVRRAYAEGRCHSEVGQMVAFADELHQLLHVARVHDLFTDEKVHDRSARV